MNTKKNHTPGPWTYLPEGDSDGFTIGIDHFVMAGDVELACPHTEADARLIASAPDLLAACKDGLGVVEHALEFFNWLAFPKLRESVEKLRDKMNAAIAKATRR